MATYPKWTLTRWCMMRFSMIVCLASSLLLPAGLSAQSAASTFARGGPGSRGVSQQTTQQIQVRMAQLKSEIAKRRKALAVLETELAELEGLAKSEMEEIRLEMGRLEVGQVGRFLDQSDEFFFEVADVISKDEVEVFPAGYPGLKGVKNQGKPFIVKGIPTDKLADGKRVALDGVFLVYRTKKLDDGRTLFVVIPKPDAPIPMRPKPSGRSFGPGR